MKVKYDPLDKYPSATQKEISDACGLLPYWVCEWASLTSGIPEFTKPLKQYLDERYGFGLYEFEKSSIDGPGVYHYPGDPDLYPLIEISLDEHGTFYQYPHAIAAIPLGGEDGFFITRMD